MCPYPFHTPKAFTPSDSLIVLNHLGRNVGTATSAKQAQAVLAQQGLKGACASMRKVSGSLVFADSRCQERAHAWTLAPM